MIRPEQIPDEVVEAAARAIRQWLAYTLHKDTRASELTDGEHEELARAALAAALNAWPDMVERFFPNDPTRASGIFLPLPQEPRT